MSLHHQPRRHRRTAGVVPLLVVAVLATLLALVPAPAQAAQQGPCALTPGGAVGQPDPDAYRPAVGAVKALMIFVDFPDAVAGSGDSTQELEDLLVPQSRALFSTMSAGRLDLQVTPVRRWIRMPKGNEDYDYGRTITYEGQKAYLRDAVRAADPSVDLRPYTLLYVVPVRSAANIGVNLAFAAYPGQGLTADGIEVRNAVTFGQDLHAFGAKTLVHETGHLFGLADLYDYSGDGGGATHAYVGDWDLMGAVIGRSPGLLAWSRWTLGWLDRSQVVCAGPGQQDVVLSPVETAGGTKAVVLRTGPDTAVVAEYRRALGEDARTCQEGLLVYTLDNRVELGKGPIRVVDARPSAASCGGPLDDAPFGGDVPTWTGKDGSRLTVTAQSADSLTVRVSRPEHRVPTLSVPAGTVLAGGTAPVTVTGTPGASIVLSARQYPSTTFSQIRTGIVLDETGRAVVETRPGRNLRLVASDPTLGQLSNQPLVQVRQAVSAAVSCGTGATCRFSGSAKPVHPGQVVEVYRGSTLVKRLATTSTGTYSLTALQPRGSFVFTVRSPRTGYHAASVSPARSVRVG